MEALVVESPGRFEVREVEVPRPGRLEVLSRVRAVAICGTDPHIIKGDFPDFWPKAFPFIPGHEWSGDVIETLRMFDPENQRSVMPMSRALVHPGRELLLGPGRGDDVLFALGDFLLVLRRVQQLRQANRLG